MSAQPISDALTVANEILKIAKRDGLSLTPMQLVKLTYIAHGWALAVLDRDLFTDRIEAWKYGPVVPNLYRATKHFGRDPIPHAFVDEHTDSPLASDAQELLKEVVSKYGQLSGVKLSNLTHRAGTPWHSVYKPSVMNLEISDDLIRKHYTRKLDEYRKSNTAA